MVLRGFPGWEDGGSPGWCAPCFARAVAGGGTGGHLARITRSAVLEVLREDFVRPPAPRVCLSVPRCGACAAQCLIPVVTVMGLQFAELLAGTIVVENVFYLPGLGA